MQFILDFIYSGAMFGVILIAAGLMAVQAVFAFLIWRKGDDTYFTKFIYLTLAAVGTFGGAIASAQFTFSSGSMGGLYAGVIMLLVAGVGAVGFSIYLFITDTWLSGDEK